MGSLNVINEALTEVRENAVTLLKTLLGPFVLINGAYFLGQLNSYLLIDIALGLVIFYQHVIISITTHRIILLGPDSVPEWGIRKLSFRELYFFAHAMGVLLIFFGMIYFFPKLIANAALDPVNGWLFGIGSFTLMILCGVWLICRLSLVFPGIAIDQDVSLKLSWKLTDRHQLLIFMSVVILPILLSISFMALSLVVSLFPLSTVLMYFLTVLEQVLIIAMLSVSYRTIYRTAYNRDLRT